MASTRARVCSVRRRLAVQSFVCGALWGIAIGQVAVAGGGPGVAAILMAVGVGALAVVILGARIGSLRRRADRFGNMLDAVSAGLIVLNRDELCVATGGKLHELLGMPESWNPTGRTITEILTELARRGDFGPRLPPCTPVDPDLFRTREIEDIYIETPPGGVLSMAVSDLPDGGWVLTCTDITDQKEQTRMLARARRELEISEARARRLAREADAANAAKSAFLAAMSHEIRTPMNGIIGMTEILSETRLDGEQRGIVGTIRQSGESLLVIINDLLDFSKIEAGRMTLESVPFDLRATAEDVLKLVWPKARARGLELMLDWQPGLPRAYVGDPQRLRQVLINLAGNAVKFTPAGRVAVRVRGHCEGATGALEIAVEDTGIGIEAADLPNVFGEFVRVDSSNARPFEGTGLGLAIAQRLTGRMGGEIVARSEPGVGSKFAVLLRLPLASADPVAGAPPVVPVAPVADWGHRRLSVLLAEDNRTNQLVICKMLQGQPIDLTVAANGAEAVALFHEQAFDLVLMDMSMPEMDGFAAVAALRAAELQAGRRRTPIIALTANAMEGDRERCLDADMDDYLSKPLRKAELVGLIRAHGRPPDEEEPPLSAAL